MTGTLGKILALCVACLVGPVRLAQADATTPDSPSRLSRISLFGEMGYAYPTGAAETGSNTRDVSFGVVPISVSGTYDLPNNWSATARFRHDVALSVGVGRVLPRRWHLTPHLGVVAGWEWLTTKLSDTGVVASRSWN